MKHDLLNINLLTKIAIDYFLRQIGKNYEFNEILIENIEITGAGYYVLIKRDSNLYVGDFYKERTFNSIDIYSSEGEPLAGSIMFIKEGYVEMVEFFCYEDAWPKGFGYLAPPPASMV